MNTRKWFLSTLILIGFMLSACAPAVKTAAPEPTSAPTRAVIPASAAPTVATPVASAVPTSALAATAQPAGTSGSKTTFRSPENASFQLPLSFPYGPEWIPQIGINTIGIVYQGNPPLPQSEWWGPGISLVDGALVHDPASAVSDQAAPADKSQFISWPNDFFGYVASLPGVKIIQGPEPVTIGGVQGSQIIVHTPRMHPILWLAGDYTWLGGGPTGVDPEMKRQMILLPVNGKHVLLEFDDSTDKFDERYPLVQEVFDSIAFGAQTAAASNPTPSDAQATDGGGVAAAQQTVTLPVNPDRGNVYAFDSFWLLDDISGLVTRWDPASNKVLASIQVGDPKKTPYGDPVAAVATQDGLWVTSVATSEVVHINPQTNQVDERIPLGEVDGKPFVTNTMIGDGQSLWVWDYDRNIALKIDLAEKKVAATLPNFNPQLIANGSVWGIEVQHSDTASRLLRLDPKTDQVAAKVSLTPPATQQAGSADSFWFIGGRTLFKIDPQTNQVVASVDPGAQPMFTREYGGSLWVTASPNPPSCHDLNKSFLVKIDPNTNQVVGKLGMDCPLGIEPVGQDLWVFNGVAPQAVVVQPAN
jgi:hypothetical protein